MNLSTYFILGFLGSFIGTIPLGPINLSIVDTTIKKSFQAAMLMALAASIIELIYSFISLHCSVFFIGFLHSNPIITYGIGAIFIILGILLFFKKKKEKAIDDKKRDTPFIKGLFIAALNPQAIPFWIFVISYYQMNMWLHMEVEDKFLMMFIFVLGAAIGKMACLFLFSYLSVKIEKHLSKISSYMSKVIGVVLIFIGLTQFFK